MFLELRWLEVDGFALRHWLNTEAESYLYRILTLSTLRHQRAYQRSKALCGQYLRTRKQPDNTSI